MKINKKIKLMCIGLFFIGGMAANAQLTLPGGNSNISDVPIDGFITVGILAGACIGLRNRIKGIK